MTSKYPVLQQNSDPVPQQQRSGLRPVHAVAVGVTAVAAVIVAFWVLHFIAGAVFLVIKLAIVIAIIALVARFVMRRARRAR
jgi:Flp pilus assembly protein TadB